MSSFLENELNISEDECGKMKNTNAKRILTFINEIKKQENLDELEAGDVILFCGNTGSGKTKLADFLHGNNEDLISHEVVEGSKNYVIYHKNDDIDADLTVESKTKSFEVSKDPNSGEIIIDVGGLNNTGRDEIYDIAVVFSIRTVLEKARSIKIALIADYSSLRKGGNRYDFPLLLQNLTVLLKNVEKYLDGMVLIATKVDSNDDVSDAPIIDGITRFLTDVKQWSLNMQNSQQIYISKFIQREKELLIRNVPILMDALLQKDGSEYSRLGIFRRPNTSGPLSEIQICQENKKKLKALLNTTKFVPLITNDFGFPISFKSKLIVRDLADEIRENIEFYLQQTTEELISHCESILLILSDDETMLKNQLSAHYEGLTRIRSIGESNNVQNIVDHMKLNLTKSCRHVVCSFLDNIENLGKILNFLGKICARNFTFCSKVWRNSLEVAISYVEEALRTVSEAMTGSAFSFYDWLIKIWDSFKEKCRQVYQKVSDFLNEL